MARLPNISCTTNIGIAGAMSRADFTLLLLTPGTLAFLKSAR
jgi:hypothetical protein